MTNDRQTQPEQDKDQIIKGQMEKMVDTYDAYMKKATFGREHILRRMTVELAGVKAGDTVLEVGCATGTLTLAAKQAAGPSGQVFGIDIIPGMIEASQRKAAQANMEVTFKVGSIDSIPFPDSHFDEVMCSFMIFHMSDETRRKGIAEIQRVLKPGGRLLLLDLALPPQPFQRWIARKLLGFSAEDDLRNLIPLMDASDFSDMEYGLSKFRILGLSVVGYVRGSARKGLN
jgi:ubiquinone/menaquinone biosynthesis C-methylase UbiE